VPDTPPYLLPFLLETPETDLETVDGVDLYLPRGSDPAPAAVLIHGGPLSDAVTVGPREWPAYVGYAALLARAGVVGVMFEHRYRVGEPMAAAYEDIRAKIETARAHPRVDPDRLAVWAFSAGGSFLGPFLAQPPDWLRAVAATYAGMRPRTTELVSAVDAVAGGLPVPTLVTRVELDYPMVAATVRDFVAVALDAEIIDVPGARHGFETVDHTDVARDAVRAAVAWVATRLTA